MTLKNMTAMALGFFCDSWHEDDHVGFQDPYKYGYQHRPGPDNPQRPPFVAYVTVSSARHLWPLLKRRNMRTTGRKVVSEHAEDGTDVKLPFQPIAQCHGPSTHTRA